MEVSNYLVILVLVANRRWNELNQDQEWTINTKVPNLTWKMIKRYIDRLIDRARERSKE